MSKKKITNAEFVETEEQKKELLKVINNYQNIEGPLMPILQETQKIYGYLPYEVMKRISEKLSKPIEEIYGVSTFYTQFRLMPQGKYAISLCLGTVCYIKGSGEILEEIEKLLGISNGECTKDGKFSLDTTRCLGCCGLAPVIMINNDVYGNVTRKQVKEILAKYE